MQYLRTASGRFINAANITLLTPEHGESEAITGWVATCRDGQTVALAHYFTLPGKIEAVLDYLPTDIVVLNRNEGTPRCPSGSCCADAGAGHRDEGRVAPDADTKPPCFVGQPLFDLA